MTELHGNYRTGFELHADVGAPWNGPIGKHGPTPHELFTIFCRAFSEQVHNTAKSTLDDLDARLYTSEGSFWTRDAAFRVYNSLSEAELNTLQRYVVDKGEARKSRLLKITAESVTQLADALWPHVRAAIGKADHYLKGECSRREYCQDVEGLVADAMKLPLIRDDTMRDKYKHAGLKEMFLSIPLTMKQGMSAYSESLVQPEELLSGSH